jgi:hypothetical protein
MLHAFNQKNVRRVLAQRADDHVNDKNEDGVTSMVFSPLEFMPTAQVLEVLQAVVGASLRDAIGGREVIAHDLRFWPSGLRAAGWSSDGESRCEPDLLVRLTMAEGRPLTLVGEMKWDWMIAADHLAEEMQRERSAVSQEQPDAKLLVFAITKARIAKAPPHTVLRTWVQVQHEAKMLHRHAPLSIAGKWGDLVSTFLAKAKQASFQGFHVPDQVRLPRTTPVFWKQADV